MYVRSIFGIVFLMLSLFCRPQTKLIDSKVANKKNIDSNVFDKWPSAETPTISSDGTYALFVIRNQPAGKSTLVIRSLSNNWEKAIINARNASFTHDNSKVIYIDSGGNLIILSLSDEKTELVPNVNFFQLYQQANNEWICYQLGNDSNELILCNSETGQKMQFQNVINYLFGGDVLLLQKVSKLNSGLQTLTWINFAKRKSVDIWEGDSASNFVFDNSSMHLAFVEQNEEGEESIWLYSEGDDKASLLANNQANGIDSNLKIDYLHGFSKDGNRLFIDLKEKAHSKLKLTAVMVDVWSYRDVRLQSRQLDDLNEGLSRYNAVLDITEKRVVQLKRDGDEICSDGINESGDYAIIKAGNISEMFWNEGTQTYLASLISGERRKIAIDEEALSPSGKYIIGRNRYVGSDIFIYDVQKGRTYNITKNIKGTYKDGQLPPSMNRKWIQFTNWIRDEDGLLVNDGYDIWLVNPKDEAQNKDLTNGYGKRNNIIFRLPQVYENRFLSKGERAIVIGFNRDTKDEGLYEVEIGEISDPKLLTKGPFVCEVPKTPYNLLQLESPNRKVFLVRLESSAKSPNYFLTTDFKTFNPVTDVYPETNYKWLTTELLTWKSLDNRMLQGVLYKPENFDAEKKYPIIIHYYENKSDELNKYHTPHPLQDNINIPLFVANGYLVFTPDIKYRWGAVGESCFNSIVSAAQYLSKFPFVDSKHMGIQGHSFGSYETNYIVTHTTLFAAAMSSCGSSDLVSHYGSLSHSRASAPFYETGQGKIGATLWQNPKAYIDGSPVLNAHHVSSPLLMMANKRDDWNFSQQLELFLALRRLGKKTWMLQYDNGGHGVWGSEAEDFTVRIFQFFDHYLKDSACPRWMLYGIRASQKGIDDGLELVREKDPKTGKWLTPPEGGLLTDEEKKKVEKLKHRKPITITLE